MVINKTQLEFEETLKVILREQMSPSIESALLCVAQLVVQLHWDLHFFY